MLLLRRKRGQSIVIGRHAEIKVKIIKEEDGVVTVGIEAPSAILVDREELYRKKEVERLAAQLPQDMKTSHATSSLELASKKGASHVTA
jgi:carbon storage regulator